MSDAGVSDERGSAGHVFVYRGDIRTLACDAWYFPMDTDLAFSPAWLQGDEQLADAVSAVRREDLPADWGGDGRRVHPLTLTDARRATPVLAAINVRGTNDPSYHRETLRQFVEATAALPRPKGMERAKRLLAVPLIGTGDSGGMWHRGKHLQSVLKGLAEEAERVSIDIALVTRDGPSTAAAHAVRRTMTYRALSWDELSGDLHDHARRLAELARRGQLVIFSGAGLGRSAGLPDWKQLLIELATKSGFDEPVKTRLAQLDVLDQAALLSGRLGASEMTDYIAELLNVPHHGLSHGLIANMPVHEIATLNYDQLHELAAKGAGFELSVLPYEPVSDRWLLKMHGCIAPGRRQDIVLTRSQYLGFSQHRASLTGLVQALLVTRHMLFVGFALRDDHFHSVVHDVRRALGDNARTGKLGTALLLEPDELQQELWEKDLSYVATGHGGLESARRLEIFLDLVLSLASGSDVYLFDATFEEVLTKDERALRDELKVLASRVSAFADAPAWQRVRQLLDDLGAPPAKSDRRVR